MKALSGVGKADEPDLHNVISASDHNNSINGAIRRRRLSLIILLLLLVFASLLYLAVINPQTFGSHHDDSIYVVTAKSLAEGQGYRIMSLPYEPAQTKYPPLYPMLLSVIWRLMPEFPSNVVAMMVLSVVATVAFVWLSYRYLVGCGYARGWQALVIVGLVAFNWRTMIHGTRIYSEMIYALLSVSALMLAERYERERRGWPSGAIVGVALGLCFLTRSAGLSLIAAVGLYHLIKREWKRAIAPVMVAGLFVLAWVIWTQVNMTSYVGINAAYYTSYPGDLMEMIHDESAATGSSTPIVLLRIVVTNLIGIGVLAVPVVSLAMNFQSIGYLIVAFVFVFTGYLRQARKDMRLLHIYVPCYLGVHSVWLPYISYDRFLVPLLPFLLMYLITELVWLTSLSRETMSARGKAAKKLSAALIVLALFASVGVGLYHYGLGLKWLLSSASFTKTSRPFPGDAQAIEWINANTEPMDVLLCYRDPLYYLYTGRRATRSFAMRGSVSWQDKQQRVFELISENRAKYLILTSTDFEVENQPGLRLESFKKLLEASPHIFEPVYESADGQSRVYRIAQDLR